MCLLSQDILRFHAVYWPGMLLSARLAVPHRVFGHGFLTSNGLKMGKSMGNVVDPKVVSYCSCTTDCAAVLLHVFMGRTSLLR